MIRQPWFPEVSLVGEGTGGVGTAVFSGVAFFPSFLGFEGGSTAFLVSGAGAAVNARNGDRIQTVIAKLPMYWN